MPCMPYVLFHIAVYCVRICILCMFMCNVLECNKCKIFSTQVPFRNESPTLVQQLFKHCTDCTHSIHTTHRHMCSCVIVAQQQQQQKYNTPVKKAKELCIVNNCNHRKWNRDYESSANKKLRNEVKC